MSKTSKTAAKAPVAKIALAQNKSLDKIFMKEHNLVVKSQKDLTVIGRIENKEFIELDDEAVQLCEEHGFTYDKSLLTKGSEAEVPEDAGSDAEDADAEDTKPEKSKAKGKAPTKAAPAKKGAKKESVPEEAEDASDDEADAAEPEPEKKPAAKGKAVEKKPAEKPAGKAAKPSESPLDSLLAKHAEELKELVSGLSEGNSGDEGLATELAEVKKELEETKKKLTKANKALKAATADDE